MKRPRTTFAAPFVLVLGCGQPQEHASTPHSNAREAIDPGVMALDQPIDAAVDAPFDASVVVSSAVPCRNQKTVTCNPPVPQPQPAAPANPPAPGRALHWEIQGKELMVTVGIGSDQGIDKDWRATVVDADAHPVPKAEAVIVRVDKRQTVVRVKKVVSDDMRDLRLRLTPP